MCMSKVLLLGLLCFFSFAHTRHIPSELRQWESEDEPKPIMHHHAKSFHSPITKHPFTESDANLQDIAMNLEQTVDPMRLTLAESPSNTAECHGCNDACYKLIQNDLDQCPTYGAESTSHWLLKKFLNSDSERESMFERGRIANVHTDGNQALSGIDSWLHTLQMYCGHKPMVSHITLKLGTLTHFDLVIEQRADCTMRIYTTSSIDSYSLWSWLDTHSLKQNYDMITGNQRLLMDNLWKEGTRASFARADRRLKPSEKQIALETNVTVHTVTLFDEKIPVKSLPRASLDSLEAARQRWGQGNALSRAQFGQYTLLLSQLIHSYCDPYASMTNPSRFSGTSKRPNKFSQVFQCMGFKTQSLHQIAQEIQFGKVSPGLWQGRAAQQLLFGEVPTTQYPAHCWPVSFCSFDYDVYVYDERACTSEFNAKLKAQRSNAGAWSGQTWNGIPRE